MSFTVLAGLGGIGFALVALAINVVYARARLPMPTSGQSIDAVTSAFATAGDTLKRPAVIAPASWLFTTVFAAGLLSVFWDSGTETRAWALVGFAGVLLQNATFAVVEALRFGVASAAAHGRASVAGLWGLSTVLFGFNQLFLATAMLGFTAAGATAGLVPGWHAWLGYVGAALLFISSSASPYNIGRTNRIALTGLVGWLGWIAWIVVYSITLLTM